MKGRAYRGEDQMITRSTFWYLLTGVVAGLTLLVGCAPLPAVQPTPVVIRQAEEIEASQEITTPMPLPTVPPTPANAESTSLEARAAVDLAHRLNVPADKVEVVSSQKTEMPVGSLGCGPTEGVGQPGLLIGDEIVLRAGGLEYTYRSDGRRLVPCSPAAFPGGRDAVLLPGNRSADADSQNAAADDLAKRLGITKSAIRLVLIEAVQWPDASLGCPQPGMMYAQVITPGYRIVLEVNGKQYEYHTGRGGKVVLCEK
jgi:hypothetical protein